MAGLMLGDKNILPDEIKDILPEDAREYIGKDYKTDTTYHQKKNKDDE